MQAHLFGRPEVTRILLLEPTGVLVGIAPYRALRAELHARGFTVDAAADTPGTALPPVTALPPGTASDQVVAADVSESGLFDLPNMASAVTSAVTRARERFTHLDPNLDPNLASLDDGTATTAAAATRGAAAAAVAAAAEAAAASRERDAAAFSAASGVRTLRISLARFEGRTLDRRLVETLCAVRAAECMLMVSDGL